MEQVERSIFRRVTRLPSVAAWGIVLMIAIPGQASGQAFPVWVSSNLVRVRQADAPGTTSSINLYSGRGETVASQVVVQAPAGGLTNVNLSVSALTGPNGATIPASSMTLYREYYGHCYRYHELWRWQQSTSGFGNLPRAAHPLQ